MKCSKYRFPTITVTKLRFWILKLVTRFISVFQMETKSTVKVSDVTRLIFQRFFGLESIPNTHVHSRILRGVNFWVPSWRPYQVDVNTFYRF